MESNGKLKLEREGEQYNLEVWEGTDVDTYWYSQQQLDLLNQYYFELPPPPQTLKDHEDKALASLDALEDVEKWIIYKYLNNQGYRMSDADKQIRKLLKAKA